MNFILCLEASEFLLGYCLPVVAAFLTPPWPFLYKGVVFSMDSIYDHFRLLIFFCQAHDSQKYNGDKDRLPQASASQSTAFCRARDHSQITLK